MDMPLEELMRKLLTVVLIVAGSGQEIERGLSLEWNDFEDSVQYSVAYCRRWRGLSRTFNDHKKAKIKVWKPGELPS